MENKKNIVVKKISVAAVLEAFNGLYHLGVDYVDISGEKGDKQDSIFLTFSRDYMDPDYGDNFENIDTEDAKQENIDVKLSDEDLNQIS